MLGTPLSARRTRIGRSAAHRALAVSTALLVALGAVGTAECQEGGTDVPKSWRTREEDPEGPPGRWSFARDSRAAVALTPEQREEAERLRSLGYFGGYEPAPVESGVTVYDPSRAWNGLNFYVSGDRPGALLMDMDGNVLHEWRYAFHDAWPGYPVDEASEKHEMDFWFHAHLFENGDVLAIFTGLGLIKLDRNSNLLWKYMEGCHHDLHVMEDGTICVLTRKEKVIPRFHRKARILADAVTMLTAGGDEIKRISLFDAFWNSRYASSLAPPVDPVVIPGVLDMFHTNKIEPLDASFSDRLPSFQAGNLLISLRSMNALAVLDTEHEEIVWALSGMWLRQHDPDVLENGNILLFDNQGDYGSSRVIEFDPLTQEVAWMYRGDESQDFFSESGGSSQRLPNGNTLITETHFGRAFEVTRDGTIVWEYVNPERAGEKSELIAALFDVTRLPPQFPIGWAGQR